MSIKLLHKTLRVYILFSLLVILLSAPLFYLFTERLFVDEADETLLLHHKEFLAYNQPTMKIGDISLWNKISRDVKIEPSLPLLAHDSIFYHSYLDTLVAELEPYRVLLSPITIEGESYTFMARLNMIESEDLIESIATLFCLTLGLLLAGLYFITRILSFKLWLPFYSTLNQIEKFELDKNLKPDFIDTDVEEFTRLNQSINRLLDKNLSVYKDQKEFIENAAHELQTPLAVFQAKLDVLVQQIPLTNEVGDTLTNLNDAISRLNRINKNLLLLSKIENHQYAAFENISVNDIVKKQVQFLVEQGEPNNIRVHVDYLNAVEIKANATLLEIAIQNLLLNALRHNQHNGQIVVRLQLNSLSIANTSGSVKLHSEKLFQRFSSIGSEGGNGLGLAIVKKINDLHGWVLGYKYQENNMHLFTIDF